ncbi:MAG TPA: glucose-1-phosphate thymidylyltransferase [Phycisphaerales bacterium]|nr:glucose-1-phosphate thymidylyltransferase [Phycisphaerales bacterium]
MSMTDKAVILARGLGTRMRKADDGAPLDAAQAAVADTGVKALMPVGEGRPFLDYVLTALADAGYRRICLIVGPEHGALFARYGGGRLRRLGIDFAVQEKPLGTADAVRAAEAFAAGDEFLVVNSDNYYPPEALRTLRETSGGALAGFRREGLLRGNIAAERIEKFAVLDVDPYGFLRRIVENPDPAILRSLSGPVRVSMNCWRFGPWIFPACRSVSPSPRGELELPAAVQFAVDRLGQRLRVLDFDLPVLDLSCRADVATVRDRVARLGVNL